MAYLLAKYTLLFFLTALLSFILGHWWSRRRFVDVTDSFESLRRAATNDGGMWDRLWQRLDGIDDRKIPATSNPDLSGVVARMDKLESAVGAIRIPEPRGFGPIEERIDKLHAAVKDLSATPPARLNLEPVTERFTALEAAIQAITRPEKPAPLDLGPVTMRIEQITAQLATLETTIRDLPRPQPSAPTDLGPVMDRLTTIENTVKNLPKPDRPAPVDLAPLGTRIDALESAIRRIPAPVKSAAVDLDPINSKLASFEKLLKSSSPPQTANLEPVDKRLQNIESMLRERKPRAASPAPTKRAEPVLLKSATHGKKDDLKRISGVGPKLERLLNANGVYYFWQVASWSKKDIDIVDARLQVFKGRIARDGWVSQAKKLRRSPGAAKMPG